MTKRIFNSICLVTFVVLLASVVLIMGVLYEYFSGVQQEKLKAQTILTAQGLSHEGLDYLRDVDAGIYRLTWVGVDGSVLYDSLADADGMENHLDREEITQAMETGYGKSSRYSATLTERLFYYAVRLPDGSVVRLADAQYTMLTLSLAILQPILVIVFAAILLALFLALGLSRKIVAPLNDFDLNHPASNLVYPELAPLAERLDLQQRQLNSRSAELRQRQEELSAITDSMSEGLVLLNGEGNIISINRFAAKLLGLENISSGEQRLKACTPELPALIDSAMQGESAECLINLGEGTYQFSVSPVVTDAVVTGAAIVIFDMTDSARSEQMRREFTANVSHELKTPLHSISGYAELMKNGMVKQEDLCRFSGQIYSEAQRMIRLIDDIIRLSHLDEDKGETAAEKIDLSSIAVETASAFEAAAKKADVALTVSGESACIIGVPQQVRSIVQNLCDNAVKYNRPGGSVHVEVKCAPGQAILSVKDTGIGIPPEHQDRIFERFYRVDKSHSKEVGGTGLGLSIVKHAARLHHADIALKSEAEKGTEVTVIFPRLE